MHEMFFTEKELTLLRLVVSRNLEAAPEGRHADVVLTLQTILKKIKTELEIMD